VPWSHFKGLQPITQIIFFVQKQQHLSRSWFRRWVQIFYPFATILKGCKFSVFLFFWRTKPNFCAIEVFHGQIMRWFFCELVVQFVTYNFFLFLFDFMGGTIVWAIPVSQDIMDLQIPKRLEVGKFDEKRYHFGIEKSITRSWLELCFVFSKLAAWRGWLRLISRD